MNAYGFDLKKVGTSVNSSELTKLKEIVLVRDFIIKQKNVSEGTRKKWLLVGLAALVIGAGLTSLSIVISETASKTYTYRYESKGIIKEGESRYIYTSMPEYKQFIVTASLEEFHNKYKKDPLFSRLDYSIKQFDQHIGEFYDTQTEQGSRRYLLTNVIKKPFNMKIIWVLITTGVMFLVAGFTSIFISKRW
jgi:hypothetical protein